MTDRRFPKRVALLVLPALLLVSSQPARADDRGFPPAIEKILALPEDKIDTGLAALTFAKEIFPGTDIEAESKKIDVLAAEAEALNNGNPDPDHVIRAPFVPIGEAVRKALGVSG